MNLKIKNTDFLHYNNLVVNLRYNQVASSFSFAALFNPDNATHREIFRPGAFPPVVIEHNGETLLTGTMWPSNLVETPSPELAGYAGYSKSGVLEDSGIHPGSFPVQYDGLSLKQIAEKLLQPFGIRLVVDASVTSLANKVYDTSTGSVSGSVKSYLAELCAQRNIIMTHNERGDLVLSKAPAKQLPVFDFEDGMPGYKYGFQYNGQGMHSSIVVRKQADADGGNAGQASIANPYGSGRVCVRNVQQSSGKDTDTADAARNILSEELLGIKYTIEMEGWTLGGKIVRPGMWVSLKSREVWLFDKTNLFVDAVDLTGDTEKETAVLTCVLPEVYNGGTVKNIFNP